ncbi:SETD3 family histone-lysine N-methyltransferase [Brucella tritici]|jgi:hypothetical protein|uniref:SETD3 family histone-lysine N-methyltransferase n=1 Tax=Brucella tritici TaxID=94626 RepID=A0A7V7VRN5_9HYPH|nr:MULTISPECIES: hypothetical protein [Brucella]KAB2655743.1 SETD3 family histone-lysine N-methyltransferase [Brucella tritici]KXO78364.1 hypothetical protein AYJ56_18090 [Brucella anthropi]
MPFRGNKYQGTYAPNDLQALQAAYNRCCALLDRCPTTHEDKEMLARAIIRAYETGEQDPDNIADIVAKLELARI